MSPFQLIFRILSFLASIYMLLIVIRVMLTWFQGRMNNVSMGFLAKITDPYMNKFRNIPWLRYGWLDFSPVVAIALLGLLSNIFSSLAESGTVSIKMIILYIFASAWSFVSFFINLVFILMVFRLITVLFFSAWNHPFVTQLDGILYKLTARILGFYTNKTVKYSLALGICGAIVLLVRLVLGYGITFLLNAISKI